MRTLAIAATILGSIINLAMAAEADAATRKPTRIAAQALEPALHILATERDIQVVYQSEVVGDLRTGGAVGNLTADEALIQLLQDTGLTFRYLDDSTVTIVPRAAAYSSDEATDARKTSHAAEDREGTAGRQQAADSTRAGKTLEVEEIVVTGTHLRSQKSSASPLQRYSREDIERTGSGTLQEFFAKVPQNLAGGANPRDPIFLTDGRSQNIGLGAAINLRGLGVGTTLTLLNGQRIAATGTQPFLDISLIPTSAVERVEILTDGASAIYGSDAIGGVVNIILKDDFEGLETSVRGGTVTEGGRREYSGSIAGGVSWDSGNALITSSYLHEDNLPAAGKAFSRDLALQPYDLYPRTNSLSVYGKVAQELSPWLRGSFAAMYGNRDADSVSTTDLGGGAFRIENQLPESESYYFAAGLAADLPASWQARLNGGYSETSADRVTRRTTSLGVRSEVIDATSAGLTTLDLVADGPLFAIPGGDVSLAAGAGYHLQDYRLDQGSTRVRDEREVFSAFTEVVLPVISGRNRIPGVESLQFSAALRYDRYSDFGATSNPKLGVVWEPVSGFALRGTYAESFRAPTSSDLYNRDSNTTVVSNNVSNSIGAPPTVFILALGGNADLEPERAKTWTVGASFENEGPVRFSAAANYYKVEYTDRIDRGSPGLFAPVFANPGAFEPILIRNPTQEQIAFFRQLGERGASFRIPRSGATAVPAGLDETDTVLIIDDRLRNNAGTSQDGIDLTTGVKAPIGRVELGFDFNGQYILNRNLRLTAASAEFSDLNAPYVPVDFKLRSGLSLSYQAWHGSIAWNHVAAYRNNLPSANNAEIGVWDTVDLYFSYTAPPRAASLTSGLTAAISVGNLFDEAPPFMLASQGPNFDPANADPLGRFLALSITKRW